MRAAQRGGNTNLLWHWHNTITAFLRPASETQNTLKAREKRGRCLVPFCSHLYTNAQAGGDIEFALLTCQRVGASNFLLVVGASRVVMGPRHMNGIHLHGGFIANTRWPVAG